MSAEWIVPDLIPTTGLTIFVGDVASGKTTFATELASAASTGNRFLGSTISQRTTLMLCDTLDWRAVSDRMSAISELREWRTPAKDQFHLWGVDATLPGNLPSDPAGAAEHEVIQAINGINFSPAMIIIDPLACLFKRSTRAGVGAMADLLRRLALNDSATTVIFLDSHSVEDSIAMRHVVQSASSVVFIDNGRLEVKRSKVGSSEFGASFQIIPLDHQSRTFPMLLRRATRPRGFDVDPARLTAERRAVEEIADLDIPSADLVTLGRLAVEGPPGNEAEKRIDELRNQRFH